MTFRPAQLGKFKHEMMLQVEDGAMEKYFRVMGHADQVDESLKKSHASGTKVGGPTSIPADFKPRITFVDENALNDGLDGTDKPWRRIMVRVLFTCICNRLPRLTQISLFFF